MHNHREMMMDWLYSEMEEHSKMLHIYADWFDKAQSGIDVETEFKAAMSAINKVQPGEIANFLQKKQRTKVTGP